MTEITPNLLDLRNSYYFSFLERKKISIFKHRIFTLRILRIEYVTRQIYKSMNIVSLTSYYTETLPELKVKYKKWNNWKAWK